MRGNSPSLPSATGDASPTKEGKCYVQTSWPKHNGLSQIDWVPGAFHKEAGGFSLLLPVCRAEDSVEVKALVEVPLGLSAELTAGCSHTVPPHNPLTGCSSLLGDDALIIRAEVLRTNGSAILSERVSQT